MMERAHQAQQGKLDIIAQTPIFSELPHNIVVMEKRCFDITKTVASSDEIPSGKLLSLVAIMCRTREKVTSSDSTHVPIFSKDIRDGSRAVFALLRIPIFGDEVIGSLAAKWPDSPLTGSNATPLRKKDAPLSPADIAIFIAYGRQFKHTDCSGGKSHRRKISKFERKLASMSTLT